MSAHTHTAVTTHATNKLLEPTSAPHAALTMEEQRDPILHCHDMSIMWKDGLHRDCTAEMKHQGSKRQRERDRGREREREREISLCFQEMERARESERWRHRGKGVTGRHEGR